MTTIFLAILLFSTFFFMMGIGFFIRGVALKASCNSAHELAGTQSCGSCAKKEKELCPSDDETGLLDMSQISNPHRTMKDRAEKQDPGFQV